MVRRLLAIGVVLVAFEGVAACPQAISEWARACRADLEASFCADGVAVFMGHPAGAQPLSIEVRRASGPAFRRVGELSYAPVAELSDWSHAPEAWRVLFDEVARCPPPPLEAPQLEAPDTNEGPARLPGSPWRALLGLVVLAVTVGQRRRVRAWTNHRPWLLLVLPPVTLALRAVLFDEAFFHPNGQGPLWIEQALCQPSPYGPGFRELFGGAAEWGGAAPDDAVFLQQSLLASLLPPLVFVLTRAAGGRLLLAAGVTIAAMVDPMLGRLSRSEAYFSVDAVLLLAAAVAITVGARTRGWRFVAGVVAAGLLGAQASRVHAVSWIPLAVLPACVAALPGRRWSVRARQALLAAIGIGVVLAVVSGGTLWEQLNGELVTAWGGHTAERLSASTVPWAGVIGAGVVLAIARARRRAVPSALGTFLSVAAIERVNSVAQWTEAMQAANAHLFVSMLVLCAAALAGAKRVTRLAATVTLLVAIAVVFAARWRAWTTLPTDAVEANVVRQWRERFRGDDTLVYLERAGSRVQHLPVYRCGVPRQPRVITAQAGAVAPSLPRVGPLFIIETSVCGSHEGREACAELIRDVDVEWLERRSLPAVSSDHQAFNQPELQLRLGRRRDSPRRE